MLLRLRDCYSSSAEDRRAAAKLDLDAIKTLEAFAGKARQSRLKGGSVVRPSLYTPQHHHRKNTME